VNIFKNARVPIILSHLGVTLNHKRLVLYLHVPSYCYLTLSICQFQNGKVTET